MKTMKRAFDPLVSYSCVEIYRYDGPTGIITATNDLVVNMTGDSIQIIDNTTPQPQAGIHQLSIESSPQPPLRSPPGMHKQR